MNEKKNLIVSVISSITQTNQSDWNKLVSENPFYNFDFFLNLEQSLCTSIKTGWIPYHFLIKENSNIIAIIPAFKKLNSNGEYVFDHSWADAYYRMNLEYYPKLLSAIPFTPINGNRIFIDTKFKSKFNEVMIIFYDYFKQLNISSYHINFNTFDQSEKLRKLDFLQRIGIQYHWKNYDFKDFDEFLTTLKSKKKKNIIKERRHIRNLEIQISTLRGKEISKQDWMFFYKCYSKTIEKKWSYKYLNFNFFDELLKSDLNNNILLIIAKDKHKNYLACSLSFIGKDILYGRYWGCETEIAFLHFELCYYQSIEFAIRNKIKTIEAGAQGEHKISRGYRPILTYSNHWIKDERMSIAIRNYLKQEKEITLKNLEYLNRSIPFKQT